MRNLSDEELVQAALNDPQAFADLMDRHKKRLFNFINAHLITDPDQAEDVVQEAFIKAYLNLDKFDRSKKWTTWLYRIAINSAYSFLRRPKTQSLDSYYVYYLPAGNVPEAAVEAVILKEKIARAIFSLESRHKIILNLYYFKEMNYEEISEVLDLDKNTVKNRVEVALRLLRGTLRAL